MMNLTKLGKDYETYEFIKYLFLYHRNMKAINRYYNIKDNESFKSEEAVKRRKLNNHKCYINKLKIERENEDYKNKRKIYMREYYLNKIK